MLIGVTEREEIEGGIEKLFEEIMAEKFPNYTNYKPPVPRISTNPKEDQQKENHREAYYNQIIKKRKY